MDSTAVILFGLVATSMLLCIALAVAWRRFGKETHAALWSLAYGLSAANWTAGLVRVWLLPAESELNLLSIICSVGSFALIALGFRRRAGLPLRTDAICTAGMVTILFSASALIGTSGNAWIRGLIALFCALMLGVSASSLRIRGTDGSRARGNAAFWMLALFAAYTLGLGILAIVEPPSGGNGAYDLYKLLLLMGVPTGLFGVGLFAMFLLAADLAEQLRRLASLDPLTSVLNRRGLDQMAGALLTRCQRQARPFILVLADIDRFKRINDCFGHAVGDAVLRRFAAYVDGLRRPDDLFGRLGGEEFVIVLPSTETVQAMEMVEQIRSGLGSILAELVPGPPITVSFGVAALDKGNDTLADMLSRADKALYRSKVEGRNRVTLAPALASDGESLHLSWTTRQAAG